MKPEDFLDRGALSEEDRRLVERQLGRRLRGEVRAASRCLHGKVQVIATSPLLDDGTPFPTLFWLTCPLLQREVSRLEDGDLREILRQRLADDEDFASALRGAEEEYRSLREEWAERLGCGDKVRKLFVSRAGIGGTVAGGLKCLHAHLAHYLAGGENPVGEAVYEKMGNPQERECPGDCEPFLGRGR
ncbi:MAG: DUF501 domain-containing protein [Actinomycetota bacterium]|nr:DUF501 domain-containing protein [Actinomycetota bacterium]MDI7252314.1 DUF501 domain-containing protein [Actinomycetota bacterium]